MCQTSGIDVSANVLDITLAQEVLQWKPQITIEEDLKKHSSI
jgi:nucleoside-diphosphate-sugar epimerase